LRCLCDGMFNGMLYGKCVDFAEIWQAKFWRASLALATTGSAQSQQQVAPVLLSAVGSILCSVGKQGIVRS